MHPRIGISCRLKVGPGHDRTVVGVTDAFIDSIIEAGGLPVLIPLTTNQEILREIYDSVDALLIPGGEDVHPKFYGEEPHPKLGPTSEIRDRVEIQLIRWAYADDKPVLGICRGIQVINVALGGSLIQDIADQTPGALAHTTPDGATMWDSSAHEIVLASDSRLALLLGKTKIMVNSVHHQAVKRLSPHLVKTAESSDGTIEALEAKGRNFFMALQCHPEMLWQKAPDREWLKLFSAFVAAAKLKHDS